MWSQNYKNQKDQILILTKFLFGWNSLMVKINKIKTSKSIIKYLFLKNHQMEYQLFLWVKTNEITINS